MKTIRNLKSGITLVEVLVSVGILGTCFACLVTALSTGTISIYNAKNHIQALNIAKQKIEELKLRGYNGIIAGDGTILINTGPIAVTIDDGGTPNEDFNFNGKVDMELDENDDPIPGTGEDLNGNGKLDGREDDDILGSLIITVGDKIDLEGSTGDDYDDALPVTVTVTWERRIGGQNVKETIHVLIAREGTT